MSVIRKKITYKYFQCRQCKKLIKAASAIAHLDKVHGFKTNCPELALKLYFDEVCKLHRKKKSKLELAKQTLITEEFKCRKCGVSLPKNEEKITKHFKVSHALSLTKKQRKCIHALVNGIDNIVPNKPSKKSFTGYESKPEFDEPSEDLMDLKKGLRF
jgi:hypothetical protein